MAAGARVWALGRNQERLALLCEEGCRGAYGVDLTNRDAVMEACGALPAADLLLVLSGTADVGRLTRERRDALWATNYDGPVALARHAPMKFGSMIGMVTSASAGMGDVREILDYQECKRAMAEWVAESRPGYAMKGVGLTLISMGAVQTPIWESMPMLPQLVADAFGWPAERAAQVLLEDVAERREFSYPGAGARMAPVMADGQYRPNPMTKLAWTLATRLMMRTGI